MLGEVDPIDFLIAQDIGMPLTLVRELPMSEIIEWRAWYAVKQALEKPSESWQQK